MGLIVLLVATSGAFVASSTQSSPARKQRHFLLVHLPFDLHWHDIAGRDVDDVPRLKCLQASLKETLGHADQHKVHQQGSNAISCLCTYPLTCTGMILLAVMWTMFRD